MPPFSAPTRRTFMAGGGAALAAPLLSATLMRCSGGVAAENAPSARLPETPIGNGRAITLTAAEHPLRLSPGMGPTPAWVYGNSPFPVLRIRQGDMLDVTLANMLPEHSTIHWHGIRGPNAMDGVAFVTQLPVEPGKTFRYRFAPPDPGTFFFHPHCDTVQQLGRGLIGVLIVDGDEQEPFDDDIICVLKDWRVAKDGSFLPFLTLAGAGRAGTFGTLRTANAHPVPEIAVRAGADIRLRILNVDSTRVGDIGVMGADASVLAVDGNALTPFALDTWRLGPAMRLDVSLRTPPEGKSFALTDFFAAAPVTLAKFVSHGAPKRSGAYAPTALKPVAFQEPDIAKATAHFLKLSEAAVGTDYPDPPPIVLPDGRKIDVLDSLCSNARTLWAIDGKTWPRTGHQHLPPPLMRFAKGETASIEFLNTTPHAHPMHLHGHSFKVLSANKLKRPVHWADTVLVMPDERVRIAFVANNPGNWMLHCHIIEHQDTGMMGWFRVG
jgi:FtsP/CotA-like multicopper oxidase with cupredoxin domain